MSGKRHHVLDEGERLSVVVTELVRLATSEDVSTSAAARRVLLSLSRDPNMSVDDRDVVRVVCR